MSRSLLNKAVGLVLGLTLVAAGPLTINDARADVAHEINCLALNVYHEARGEPETGQLAVAYVVMNRVADPKFPASICKVVTQGGDRHRYRCQFSWWCDGRSDRPRNARAWLESQIVAHIVYTGSAPDPTGGALFYHTLDVSPRWQKAFEQGPVIGRHVFYTLPPARGRRHKVPRS